MKGNNREQQRQRIENDLIKDIDAKRTPRPSIGWPVTMRELLRFTQPVEAFILEGMIDGERPQMAETR